MNGLYINVYHCLTCHQEIELFSVCYTVICTPRQRGGRGRHHAMAGRMPRDTYPTHNGKVWRI